MSVLLMCLHTGTAAAASFTITNIISTNIIIIIFIIIIIIVVVAVVGQDSAVGIVTRYCLDSLGFKSRWGRYFPHPIKLSLGPTQTPILWVLGLTWG